MKGGGRRKSLRRNRGREGCSSRTGAESFGLNIGKMGMHLCD
jgi:hypothetical protein